MTPLERIMVMSIPEPNSGCWIWMGSTRGSSPTHQYGRMTVGSRSDGSRRTVSAHRYSFEAANGEPPPPGSEVCHRCDNPLCVNPAHLWAGTKRQNIADRERKGRNKPAFGEKNGQSKLTRTQVAAIRESLLGCRRLAAQFGVDKRTIQRARNGVHWNPAAPANAKGGE